MAPKADLRHEYHLLAQDFHAIAGLDEAGRGAWAGPVVAGAVIFPLQRFDLARVLAEVNDSKQLTPTQREMLLPLIMENVVAAGIGYASNTEIDALGIVPSTQLAMQRALAALSTVPDALLVDALALPGVPIPCTALKKGDQRSLSIAAASILAKVTRDQFMDKLDATFPQYGFREHKGYGTPLHQQSLEHFGPCTAHRMTFAPVEAVIAVREGKHET